MPAEISALDVQKHASLEDMWLVVNGFVYDMTEFAPAHPGGASILLQYAGRDATAAYDDVHAPLLIKSTLPVAKHVGVLDKNTVPESWTQSLSQLRISRRSMPAKPLLETLINARDFEAAASVSYSPKTWAFVSSAATDLYTKRRNASTYAAITLRPRVLVDVRHVNISTAILGHRVRAPIFCAPTSLGKVFHPDGEKELGRACRDLGLAQYISTSASYPLREIAAAVSSHFPLAGDDEGPSDGVLFFQLYVDKIRVRSEALLREAASLPGVRGVVMTVDSPVAGKREADERAAVEESLSNPRTGEQARNDSKGGGLGRTTGNYIDASVTWDDIAWVRRTVPGMPVVLKGIQTAMDAVRAMDVGVDGIVLSNHGGRSLDTSPATILVLLELRRCCPQVFDKMEVYVDGGISRGTDIFKALCLGAKAVGIGRGFLYGLNYGREGVRRYAEILIDELETTMRMCGATSLDQLHPGLISTLAVDHLIPTTEEHHYSKWRSNMRNKL